MNPVFPPSGCILHIISSIFQTDRQPAVMEPTGIHAAGRDGGAAGDDGVSLDIIGCRDCTDQ